MLAAAKSRVVKLNIDKVNRLADDIIAAINQHLDEEPMTGAEVIQALNKAAYLVTKTWIEAQKEPEKRARGSAAA